MKKTKTKCYLYTRVSTSMQVDGYSLDAQRDKLRKYAEYEDMVVAGEYSDEGFPARIFRADTNFSGCCKTFRTAKMAWNMCWCSNCLDSEEMLPMY